MDDKTMLERFVVKKGSGSRWARVVHVLTGETVKRFDVLRGNGWEDADKYCAALNKEHEKAAAEIGKAMGRG